VKTRIPLFITMVVGWITLLTYFITGVFPGIIALRYVLTELAIIVAAFALILGFFNLLSVHAMHIVRQHPNWFYSFVLIASMIVMVPLVHGLDLVSAAANGQNLAQQSISGTWMINLYKYVLIPIQSSLEALLPFLLALAAYRTLRMRRTFGGAIFLFFAILVLLGQVPLFNLGILKTARDWIVQVWAMAGMRGILLGVALGITATALRVLIGADRPSSD
jgi:hypothetical protein